MLYVAIMTTAGIVLPIIPLHRTFTMPATDSSDFALMSPSLSSNKTLALSRVENISSVPSVPLVLVTSADGLNSQSSATAALRKSEKIAASRRKKARRERKRQRAMPPPPPPPLPPPTPLQVWVMLCRLMYFTIQCLPYYSQSHSLVPLTDYQCNVVMLCISRGIFHRWHLRMLISMLVKNLTMLRL